MRRGLFWRRVEPPPPVVACYPGSFNPPTVAHLAVAGAAIRKLGLTRVDFTISRLALGKDELVGPSLEDRIGVLERMASTRPWMGVRVTEQQLLVDLAQGYDALIMGADKWDQVLDARWYGSEAARDDALARLPYVLVAPRAGQHPQGVDVLPVDETFADVSATRARAGDRALMADEARAFDDETGAWTDPERYWASRT